MKINALSDTPLVIWRAILRSEHNRLRSDVRLRTGYGISLLVGITLAIWSSWTLLEHLQSWQAQGLPILYRGLWQTCLVLWSGTGLFTLADIPRALSSDETLLLFTQPLSTATRFRVLVGSFFVSNTGLLLHILQCASLCIVLCSCLGWTAFAWLLCLELGTILSVCLTLIISCSVICLIKTRARYLLILLCLLCVTVGAITVLSLQFYSALMHFASRLLATLQPGPFLLALLLILVIIVGFGASYFGQLYSTALLLGQQRGRAHRPRQFPGTSLLLHLLSQRSGPISALWGKALANQSRNIFFWARLLIIWVLLPLFIPLHTALRQAGIADTTMISGYASLLAIFHILETGSGAISGEANRLVLYLTAPLRWSSFLRAKLFLFLSPALGEALAMGLILSRVLNLSIADVGIIIVTISLIVCICTMTLIWGSAWDEDLDITVEGALATWLQEEGAFTPRRLLLLNGCLLLLAGCVAILWKCPLIIAWPLLLLLNLFLLPAMFYFALAQLRHLVA